MLGGLFEMLYWHRPKEWSNWLPMEKWCYNTTNYSCVHLKHSYGYPPPTLLAYIPSTTAKAVEQQLKSIDPILSLLKENLQKAQHRIKLFADRKRIERSFEVGDWVFLRLQPYKQKAVAIRHNLKLAPRYYCPFQIVQRIGAVAYKLALPLIHKSSSLPCVQFEEETR
ncbi:hypothetical protein CIPAW_03G001100 [Carya illinoinensis]|uniref:Tf2-1-like SH3-like domain-containing protein n=1 Tax=Carya illinoinensis TaxID=32201 RepID=A0A8T1QX77_CARIL|nr:hypothetical protein CIPAW_03G001100 [Carya illinoinensis]